MKEVWGSAEKFLGWPKYSHWMWINEAYTRGGWKVHRQTKIFSWNMIKWDFYENQLKSSLAEHRIWSSEAYTRVGWKVHRLNKILSQNVTKWCLYDGRQKVHRLTKILSRNMTKWGLYENQQNSLLAKHGMRPTEIYMGCGWKVHQLTKRLL